MRKKRNKDKAKETYVRRLSGEEIKVATFICFISWLIVGAGHFYCGKIKKGLVFFLLLEGLFLYGMLLRGEIAIPEWRISSLDFNFVNILIFFLGLGNGLLTILQLTPYFHTGAPFVSTYEVGTLFMLVSGALNLFVILDAFDTYREMMFKYRYEEN